MAEKSVFQRIIDREIPAEIVYEDELCMAFHDIHPQSPVHLVVIPKRAIRTINELSEEDRTLVGHLFVAMGKIAAKLGLTDGYRVTINNGPDAGQEVMHLHFHFMGGRKFAWPPG